MRNSIGIDEMNRFATEEKEDDEDETRTEAEKNIQNEYVDK